MRALATGFTSCTCTGRASGSAPARLSSSSCWLRSCAWRSRSSMCCAPSARSCRGTQVAPGGHGLPLHVVKGSGEHACGYFYVWLCWAGFGLAAVIRPPPANLLDHSPLPVPHFNGLVDDGYDYSGVRFFWNNFGLLELAVLETASADPIMFMCVGGWHVAAPRLAPRGRDLSLLNLLPRGHLLHLYWTGLGFNANATGFYLLMVGELRVAIAVPHVLCTCGKVMSRPPGSRLGAWVPRPPIARGLRARESAAAALLRAPLLDRVAAGASSCACIGRAAVSTPTRWTPSCWLLGYS